MKMAHRIEGMNAASGHAPHYAGLTMKTKAGAVWTGKVAVAADNIFLAPLRWKKPARVFVNSMADLFHEDVPDEIIDRAFAVMALCPHLTFMVLTKRSKRMREYMSAPDVAARIWKAAGEIANDNERLYLWALAKAGAYWGGATPLPLPNVWLGVSVEDQPRADERIPDLLATPAAVRFLSCEPLLDLVRIPDVINRGTDGIWLDPLRPKGLGINLVIIGGESGPRSRPFALEWARSLVAQCKATGVAAFVKQLGAKPYETPLRSDPNYHRPLKLKDKKGGDMAEWPEDLRVRELPS
jgi:protein gp37